MAKLDYQYIGSLVTRAQEGDSNAFAELYAATYRKQYYIAYKYLEDEFLARDALQTIYISALKNISSISDPQLFISWLNQLNFRTCFKLANGPGHSYDRNESHTASAVGATGDDLGTGSGNGNGIGTGSVSGSGDGSGNGSGDATYPASDPESSYIHIGSRKYIVRQVMSLPFSESQAILLRYFNRLTPREIAGLLDCRPGEVRRNLRQGISRLEQLLKG